LGGLDEQAGEEQDDAGCCGGPAHAEQPAAAGDDRDRGEDDADLEADLGQLVEDVPAARRRQRGGSRR
jgi:hypothetical protein